MKTATRKAPSARKAARKSTPKTAVRRTRRIIKAHVRQGASLVTYRAVPARSGTIVFVIKTGDALTVARRSTCDFLCTAGPGKGQRARIADFIDDHDLVVDGDSKARFPWLGN
jgi:hypothetical protein